MIMKDLDKENSFFIALITGISFYEISILF